MARTTTVRLKTLQDAQEDRFWSQRAQRWITEEDDRRFLEVTEGDAPSRKRPKWAIEHLYEQERITPAQAAAARRTAEAVIVAATPPHLSASNLIGVHPDWDLTFSTELDRAARHLAVANARQAAQQARVWVCVGRGLRSYGNMTKARRKLYDRLFALPQRSWTRICRDSCINGRDEARLRTRVRDILDTLDGYWADADRNYGPTF